jgi:hypothetical protein
MCGNEFILNLNNDQNGFCSKKCRIDYIEDSDNLNEAMDEYYDELQLEFLAGMIQIHQAWESLEMRLNIKSKEDS